MNLFRIKVANHVIEIEAGFKDTIAWCRDFITDNEPDLFLKMTENDLEKEKKQFLNDNTIHMPSNSYLEFIALHRKLSEILIDQRTVLMHGAAIALHDNAYIFVAPSGTGKTTHIQKWMECCQDTIVINGDKPYVSINDDNVVFACSSPWAGKENMYTNMNVPLKSIIIMERAEKNQIKHVCYAEALPFLLKQIYHPNNMSKIHKVLQMIGDLQHSVSLFSFDCNNFEDDCFDVAYRALVENEINDK